MWSFDGQTPLTSWRFVIFMTIVHFIVTWILEKIMSKRKEPINVRRIQRYNNLMIGLFSIITFISINILAYRDGRFASLDRLVCHKPSPRGAYGLLWYLFYLSKLWEFTDIYLVILNKTPVLMHFRWHHQTTPSVMLSAFRENLSYEWPVISSNTLIHSFMYPHFAGVWNVHTILVVLGAFQLIVVLTFGIYGLIAGCSQSLYLHVYGLIIYGTYAIGYLQEHFHIFDRRSLKNE